MAAILKVWRNIITLTPPIDYCNKIYKKKLTDIGCLLLIANHTESESLCSTWLQNKGEHGNQREEAIGHDEVNNVVQVFPTQV